MKLWKSALVTAMGFILGMGITGVTALYARPVARLFSAAESEQKTEKYWQDTGLSLREVSRLMSDDKCHSSDKYEKACLNAVAQALLKFNLKISLQTGQPVPTEASDRLEEKNEKELIAIFSGIQTPLNYDRLLQNLAALETEDKRAELSARLINSFLSVYFDPHTYILPANYYDEVGSKIERSKYFVGISYEKDGGEFYVRKVSRHSDAELAGLKINDQIVSLNSVELRNHNYADLSSMLKDTRAPELKFEVKRGGRNLTLVLKRSYRLLGYVQYDEVGPGQKYGLLTLGKFGRGACVEVAEKLLLAQKQNVAGLILDMRDNPGGQLDEAACIQGLFLGQNKKAYYVEYFDATKANEVALTSEKQIYKGPLVVLVNAMSASAAELVSGGLQEYGRGLILGERTFGKGTFQEPEEWSLNPKISLFKTQGLYLLPSRNSTQLSGVTPDVELPSETGGLREGQRFFNPVQLPAQRYAKIKKTEEEKNFTYSSCSVDLGLPGEDLYLSEGLKYLGCAQPLDGATEAGVAQLNL